MRSRSKHAKTRGTKGLSRKKKIIESLLKKRRSLGGAPSCDSCGERCSS